MNIRQLSQGLLPTPEYEFHHTFYSLRKFPELKRTMKQMKQVQLKSSNITQSNHNKSKLNNQSISLQHSQLVTSTHHLDELSKSCIDEITSLSDYRKILFENRKTLKSSGDITDSNINNKNNKPTTLSNTLLPNLSTIQDINNNEEDQLSKLSDITYNISPIELANQKLTKISISFDSQNYHSHLLGFTEGAWLTKNEFNTQLKRCLNINLRKIELDALFNKMDTKNDQLIDGIEFVRYFFALGFEARWKINIDTINRNHKKLLDSKKEKSENEKKIKEWESNQILKFNESDFNSAMNKIEYAAFCWDTNSFINKVQLSGLETYLTPYEFKQQVNRSLGISLNGAEIGSIIKEYSTRSEEHCIDGYLFIKKFFQLRDKALLKYEQNNGLINKQIKLKTLQLGPQIDCLPKLLGR